MNSTNVETSTTDCSTMRGEDDNMAQSNAVSQLSHPSYGLSRCPKLQVNIDDIPICQVTAASDVDEQRSRGIVGKVDMTNIFISLLV